MKTIEEARGYLKKTWKNGKFTIFSFFDGQKTIYGVSSPGFYKKFFWPECKLVEYFEF